jgi:hypothetical protein
MGEVTSLSVTSPTRLTSVGTRGINRRIKMAADTRRSLTISSDGYRANRFNVAPQRADLRVLDVPASACTVSIARVGILETSSATPLLHASPIEWHCVFSRNRRGNRSQRPPRLNRSILACDMTKNPLRHRVAAAAACCPQRCK